MQFVDSTRLAPDPVKIRRSSYLSSRYLSPYSFDDRIGYKIRNYAARSRVANTITLYVVSSVLVVLARRPSRALKSGNWMTDDGRWTRAGYDDVARIQHRFMNS